MSGALANSSINKKPKEEPVVVKEPIVVEEPKVEPVVKKKKTTKKKVVKDVE